MSAWCVRVGNTSRIKAVSEDAYQKRTAGWSGDEYGNAVYVGGASPGEYEELDFANRFGNSLGVQAPPQRQQGDRSLLLTDAQLEEVKQPRVLRQYVVPTVEAMTDAGPKYTTPVQAIVEQSPAGPILTALVKGTGPGDLMLTPPEIEKNNLYGHKGRSGTNSEAACPDAAVVSDSALTLWSCEIDGTTRGVQFNFGVKRPGTVNPGNGFVFKRTAEDTLDIFATDDDGVMVEASRIRIYDNAGTWTMEFGTDATKYDFPGTMDPKVIIMPEIAAAELDDPPEGMVALHIDENGALAAKDSEGDPVAIGGTVSPEDLASAIATYFAANPVSGDFTGKIIMHGLASPPTGYLACDGAAVSRATYSALFTAIGETWGAGNGTTTFNVPDFRDRVPVGTGTTYTLNQAFGAASVQLTAAQSGVPAHTHTITDPGHVHVQRNRSATTGSESTHNATTIDTSSTANTNLNNTGSAATGITGANANSTAGAAEAHENRQPSRGVPFAIKT